MNKSYLKKITPLCVLFFGLIQFNSAQAAFPYDLNSGVGLTDESANAIRTFTETATLSVNISGGSIFMDSDKRNVWPGGTGSLGTVSLSCCNANAWGFRLVDGVWYGATWEWLRIGNTVRGLDDFRGGGHMKGSPLSGLRAPVNGEVIGVMVAGITRLNLRNNVPERSNIVFYRVGDGVVSYEELGFIDPNAPVENKVQMAPIIGLLND